jgi:hypothetical protein
MHADTHYSKDKALEEYNQMANKKNHLPLPVLDEAHALQSGDDVVCSAHIMSGIISMKNVGQLAHSCMKCQESDSERILGAFYMQSDKYLA